MTFFFFPLDTNTDAAGAPYLTKVLQSLKIPKAPSARSISLFPALQTNAQLSCATSEIPWSNARITHFQDHPGWQKPPEMLPPPGEAWHLQQISSASFGRHPCLSSPLSFSPSSLDQWRVIPWGPPLSTANYTAVCFQDCSLT